MKVGVLGGGQLGQMLALAGVPLGMRFRFLDPSSSAPAGAAGELVVGGYDDPPTLDRFADGLDIVTYEFENVPPEAVERLAARVPVFPPARALSEARDRLHEKRCFARLGIPTAPFAAVHDLRTLEDAARGVGLPAILKTRRLGYDGRGQHLLRTPSDIPAAWEAVGGVAAILEGFVEFDRELSILSVRGTNGSIVHYPLVENHHREGILRRSLAPALSVPDEVAAAAQRLSRLVLQELDYVGLLAIELFQRGRELIANEMAPRVHNSGHWTIEGAETSQFENHLRAIAGMPLGPGRARGFSTMLNLIGKSVAPATVLEIPGAHLHLYGKADRPGRKVGHVTLCGATAEEVQERVDRLLPHIA